MKYSAEQLEQIADAQDDWVERANELGARLATRSYRGDVASKHGRHGLGRRLFSLVHALRRVSELVPPNAGNLDPGDVRDAELMLQAFLMNVFGSIDNLAWLWVHELQVKHRTGRDLRKMEIGLGANCHHVRSSMPKGLRDRLAANDEWFRALRTYRDGIAHGVPVYIPKLLNTAARDEYERLEVEKAEAIRRLDTQAVVAVSERQDALGRYGPLMLISEAKDSMIIHGQMICDLATVVDLGENVIGALDAPQDYVSASGGAPRGVGIWS